MQKVKRDSTVWINQHKNPQVKFSWQAGYAAFSYSKSHLPRLIAYIKNQENHHKKKSFKDEYLQLLQKFEIEYDERYVFDFL